MALIRSSIGNEYKIKSALWLTNPGSVSIIDSTDLTETYQGRIQDVTNDFNFSGSYTYTTGHYDINISSRNGGHYIWQSYYNGNYTTGDVTVAAGADIFSVTGSDTLASTLIAIYEID